MAFFNAIPGAIAEGLIWGLMAIGVYISYKILDIADLTVEGSMVTGACVCVILVNNGVPAWVSIIVAFLAGAITGILTGVLHTALGIPSILAGILTQLILYSVNTAILGGKSNVSFEYNSNLMLAARDNWASILVTGLFAVAIIVLLWLFFYTEIGLTIKSTGDNPDMSSAQGVNVKLNKVLGLAISNGIVAISGALLCQYMGRADINDGRGAIVIGLAAIFIGLSVSLKIKPNFVVSLIGVIFGSIIYRLIYTAVIMVGIKTDYLKMLSAIIVIIFLATPYIKANKFKKIKDANEQIIDSVENDVGGNENVENN